VKALTFSVYYPHDQRSLLIKEAILPLVDQPNVVMFNYFLSRYKGENVTIQLLPKDDVEFRSPLKEHFQWFFERHQAPQKQVDLPLDQLFLDFPNNTLHIWEEDPFRRQTMERQEVIVDNYQTRLSTKCLRTLASQEQWDESASFGVFIELLFWMSSYLDYHGKDVKRIFSGFLTEMKYKLTGKEDLIQKYTRQGAGIYQQNKTNIDSYFKKISTQIKGSKEQQDDGGDWLTIFELKVGIEDWEQGNSPYTKLFDEFVFDVSQKIDLDQKALILALSVVSETIRESSNDRR